MTDNNFVIKKIVVGYLETNCYIVIDKPTKNAFIIDPGSESEIIIEEIEKDALIPLGIINTHGHIDHLGANPALIEKYNIPVYLGKGDEEYLSDSVLNGADYLNQKIKLTKADFLVGNGDVIEKGAFKFKILETPGHTPGGICLVLGDVMFTGDTLFNGSVGRWDFPGGSEAKIKESLKIFSGFPKEMRIYPGHGEESTIGEELKSNPYLK